ncbi:chain-length determining protein [Aquitalea sp. USM4]|uniref:chain-length determining protein n=1 Tax=Aquitalea sp. USM4 TaxID=1590041 RepID=UPI00103FD41A|nr:chain-length determining protein [Aquitalea sp. USM4]QBJ78601.1 chain-length determining protein [Aquitalea sp. USM4]
MGKLFSRIHSDLFSIRIFSRLIQLVFILAVLICGYWLVIASDRYESSASMIIRKTDSLSQQSVDLPLLISGVSSASRPDQLLLREYLLSVDMLKKLDSKLKLRRHYSDSRYDIFSRLWQEDTPMELFQRYFEKRVSVDYDEFAGVLRVKVQAYDAKTAQAIAAAMVAEGERYMNQLGHEMAETQVNYLVNQVQISQQRSQQANQLLVEYQNKKGLLSPQATAESINSIISGLESQRAQLQTQLATLPKSLDADHPNLVMLRQAISSVNSQIAQEKARLANPSGKTLNVSMEEFQRLQMDAAFKQDVYKSSLAALEKGRFDAARMLDKVSVLQSPSLPEFPLEPRRLYNILATLIIAAMLAGTLKLLEGIVLDHLD